MGERRGRPRGPVEAKRQAILSAALPVFAAHGYDGGSVEAIAAGAGISNRTVYNHFTDKAHLFAVVIEKSSSAVADAQIAIIERHLAAAPASVEALEGVLVAFATEWIEPLPGYSEHRMLIRHLRANAGSTPPSALEAWQRAGPQKVRHALAAALRRFLDAGLLRVSDPEVAALHFSRLVSVVDPLQPGQDPRSKPAAEFIELGVQAFLHGYHG